MSGILGMIGKAIVGTGIVVAHAVGSTVEIACDVGAVVGKATCEGAKGAAQVAETLGEVAANAVKRK